MLSRAQGNWLTVIHYGNLPPQLLRACRQWRAQKTRACRCRLRKFEEELVEIDDADAPAFPTHPNSAAIDPTRIGGAGGLCAPVFASSVFQSEGATAFAGGTSVARVGGGCTPAFAGGTSAACVGFGVGTRGGVCPSMSGAPLSQVARRLPALE